MQFPIHSGEFIEWTKQIGINKCREDSYDVSKENQLNEAVNLARKGVSRTEYLWDLETKHKKKALQSK